MDKKKKPSLRIAAPYLLKSWWDWLNFYLGGVFICYTVYSFAPKELGWNDSECAAYSFFGVLLFFVLRILRIEILEFTLESVTWRRWGKTLRLPFKDLESLHSWKEVVGNPDVKYPDVRHYTNFSFRSHEWKLEAAMNSHWAKNKFALWLEDNEVPFAESLEEGRMYLWRNKVNELISPADRKSSIGKTDYDLVTEWFGALFMTAQYNERFDFAAMLDSQIIQKKKEDLFQFLKPKGDYDIECTEVFASGKVGSDFTLKLSQHESFGEVYNGEVRILFLKQLSRDDFLVMDVEKV